MAQNIKFGDTDIQLPSLNFKKLGGLIPILFIIFLASSRVLIVAITLSF